MSKKKLHLNIVHGDEYRSRVGSIYEKNTFFRAAYQQAGRCVREIIEANKRYETHLNECVYKFSASDLRYDMSPKNEGNPFIDHPKLSVYSELASYPNNIIAFCGRRGQGKTSAMVSFSKALENLHLLNNTATHDFWTECLDGTTEWENWEFVVIDPVDPTLMEQTDSILRILLSRMYIKFQQVCEGRNLIGQRQDQFENQILGDFRDCYKTLDTLKDRRPNDDYYYDDLSNLADLGDSSCMKQKMTKLVSDLCHFISSERNLTKMLVLQLDDTDLNAHHAYEILEDIRKYLVIPGVIILMATEMTQLSLIVEQHFICEFEGIIEYSNLQLDKQDTLNRMNCHNSAENYIGKLFPGMHQIHLPALDDVIRRAHSQIYLHYYDEQNHSLLGNDDISCDNTEDCEYQKVLINQIYRKTRIVLLEPHSYLQNFLPSSMRQLTHFLTVLKEMSDLNPEVSMRQMIAVERQELQDQEKIQEQKEKLLHNSDLLSDYFRFVWCPIHLTTLENLEMQKIFATSSSFVHQQVMLSLKKIERAANGDKTKENANEQDNEQRYLYGNVLAHLDELRQNRYREWFYKICFAIEFYYTLFNYRRLIAGRIEIADLQAAAIIDTDVNMKLGFTLKTEPTKIQRYFKQAPMAWKNCLKDLILSGCIALRKDPEGSAESVQWEMLGDYKELRFDPQYILFPSPDDQLVQAKVMGDELTTVPLSDAHEEIPPSLQEDAKLIYWATPELQHLFSKSVRFTIQQGKYNLSKCADYLEAMQRAIAEFKKRLKNKTDIIKFETGIKFEGTPEMKNAFKKIYSWRTLDDNKKSTPQNESSKSPESIEVNPDSDRLVDKT